MQRPLSLLIIGLMLMIFSCQTQEPAEFDYYCVLPGQGKYHDPDFCVRGDKKWPQNVVSSKGHSSDMITNITLEWLENIRDKSKPFFLMHHYKAPHDMFEFSHRYADYLEDVEIPEPASMYYNANNGSVATRGEIDDQFPEIQKVIDEHWFD